jgi:hypothetical protein
MTTETLNEREQQWLEHLQRAAELDVPLTDYAAAYDLDVKDLYYGKRQLAKKGVVDEEPGKEEIPSDFVAVRLAPSSSEAVLRLRHPSGWELECRDWPCVDWLSSLMGRSHAA